MEFTRESIFVAAIRSFFKSFAVILGIAVALGVILLGLVFVTPSTMAPPKNELVIAPDALGKEDLLPLSSPDILRIDLDGVIGLDDLTANKIDGILRDSREGFLANNRIKGILLYIRTPGGTVTDSDDIYEALIEYKKKYSVPVFAYIDGLCASGGMYISAAADKIYASPTSVVGSIGVVMGPMFNFSQAMDKYGVQALTVTEGKDKDMLNPFRPWVPDEDQSLRAITLAMYNRFVDTFTAARPNLDKAKLVSDYGAQVFIAQQGQELGYIDDGNKTYANTLEELVAAAGIKETEQYQVVKIVPLRSFLADLAKGNFPLLTGKIVHSFQVSPQQDPLLSGKFLYLYQPS